ncbi:nuclear transport factor 2 family protein [Flavilitoribacter nigricans]|uniref:DUF4440 domain-containing protein n=1 Tax=Flavilitoribacter nigricans (strain ATCC 23147 / DSM 23189 / NBRC 102662 / NCIMB 1420 / SS-2) TaxID=1122177 RepID=A0A2D0NHY0_FLAN2|nr:DUF4440 domain-containing protein [Flavilitoribacter nigricans]PHN08077.1 DUF4440 domain-containing protein [Flavilitoribacter nigricans DSM 23189 = NBRC 102662]
MKTPTLLRFTGLLIFIGIVIGTELPAQSSADTAAPDDLSQQVLLADSLFWDSYNHCDLTKMITFFTEDLEFYHDKGGLTRSRSDFIKSMETGLCANEHYRMRREAVAGSVQVYPLNNYGAIITGEHLFYVQEKDQAERLDGSAKFTHVWEYKDDTWRMSRVLSYDHQPAGYVSTRQEISLSEAVLDQYTGTYQSAQIGPVVIGRDDSTLLLQAGKMKIALYPETQNSFFAKERDLRFEFIKIDDKVLKMNISENGSVVDEAKRSE